MSINPTGPKVWPAYGECMVCNDKKLVMGFDTSDEEKDYGFMCKTCIIEFLDKYHGDKT